MNTTLDNSTNTKKIGFGAHAPLERGHAKFESKIAEHEGDIMSISTRNVVTAPATINIMGAVKIMATNSFRRLPITDAGTGHIIGIVTCLDIVDFLGGGPRHKIISDKFAGNIHAAVNENIRKIMKSDAIVLTSHASIDDALNIMIAKCIGGIPILNDNGEVDAIVSERDFVQLLAGTKTGI